MTTVRRFEPRDAEALAALIAVTMRTSNAVDYPPEVLEPLIAYFTPARLVDLSAERYVLVAERAGAVVGTGALEGESIQTFFVRPDCQGQGIGRQLLEALEEGARADGITTLRVASSLTGVPFYQSAGYRRTGGELHGSGGRQLPMAKRLAGDLSM